MMLLPTNHSNKEKPNVARMLTRAYHTNPRQAKKQALMRHPRT